jgi:hypothetical protein
VSEAACSLHAWSELTVDIDVVNDETSVSKWMSRTETDRRLKQFLIYDVYTMYDRPCSDAVRRYKPTHAAAAAARAACSHRPDAGHLLASR